MSEQQPEISTDTHPADVIYVEDSAEPPQVGPARASVADQKLYPTSVTYLYVLNLASFTVVR